MTLSCRNAIFLGLSHDSGLIAELVVRPAEVSETNYNDDDVFEPDVQWVLNVYSVAPLHLLPVSKLKAIMHARPISASQHRSR